jgi:CDP-diacylglycerol--glycerol-3-phosphate 3-phosphatidyltransferase/cardiolipin synthase
MYSVLLFIAISFTDFLDGFIARNQGSTSDFGKMLDPIADKLLVVGVLTSLMITGTIEDLNIIPALLIISREIFISGLREFAANSKLENTMEVSNIGKIKTALQMISLTLILLSISFQNSIVILNIGIILLWASMILTLISGFKYYRKIFN